MKNVWDYVAGVTNFAELCTLANNLFFRENLISFSILLSFLWYRAYHRRNTILIKVVQRSFKLFATTLQLVSRAFKNK